MNPSAAGWIKKLLSLTSDLNDFLDDDQGRFYQDLKSCGFIYGSNIHVVRHAVDKKDLSNEELSKLNLFLALHYMYCQSRQDRSEIESIISFYKEIKVHKTSFFGNLINGKWSTTTLENIIHRRVQIDDNILTKNFNYFVINALLFVDVLAYQEFLINGTVSSEYTKKLEASIESIVLLVLNSKTQKTRHDKSLIKLIEASLRYQDNANITYEEAISTLNTNHKKWYLLDLACMSTWSDRVIETSEEQFLYQLGNDLMLEEEHIKKAINSVNSFYTAHKDRITLLSSSNIVKNFYDNSSKMVSKLISRNSKRLQNELSQSKQLLYLIGQSTIRDLNEDEQKKVQTQLLDIFKSIPSLAIFMLPGGMLLLPLVVKFIPKLLPSAFDDNRIEEEETQ